MIMIIIHHRHPQHQEEYFQNAPDFVKLDAIRRSNGEASRYIKNPTPELCDQVIDMLYPNSIKGFAPYMSEEQLCRCVGTDGFLIGFIPHRQRTPKVIQKAINNAPLAIRLLHPSELLDYDKKRATKL